MHDMIIMGFNKQKTEVMQMKETISELSMEELSQRIKDLESLLESTSREMIRLQNQIVDWHAAMFGAISLILKPYKKNLLLEREHLLNLMPTRIDCLVIKKNGNLPIDMDMFRLFRKHNVIEFKSSGDELNMAGIMRVIGYAANYLSQEGSPGEIPVEEVTVTVIRSAYPRKLFQQLRQAGWKVEEIYHNIYHLSGFIRIPIQVVVSKDLGEPYLPLQILTNKAKEDDVRKFLAYRERLTEKDEKDFANVILWACSQANREIFIKMEKDGKMRGVMYDILKPDIDKMLEERAQFEKTTMAERLIKRGMDGPGISDVTGYDHSQIDAIAQRLNCTVAWGEKRA